MGKKGKKKKGSGKKGGKKGKKGKKSGEPQMTWKEALLAYQINIKDKQSEDIKYEVRALQEKNSRHKERNERLMAEQKIHIKNMLKQAEEMEKKILEEEVVDKKHVVAVMMDNWDAEKSEQADIVKLKEQIAHKESEIFQEQKHVEYWKEYQDKGRHEHGKQIKLLQDELIDMQTTFDEMAAHLERTWDQAKTEIQGKTDNTLEKQKIIATEKAMAKMDKYSRQEVLDNDWLVREVDIHQKEVEQLMKEVQVLENENLSIMSELFECHVDDLKISRNFFLTQFGDSENLEQTGILEMDMDKVDLDNYRTIQEKRRPKSAVHKAIEEKVFSIVQKDDPDLQDEESEFDGDLGKTDEEEDPFDNYFQYDNEDFDEYLHLGPLELKLLSINGQSATFHKRKTPLPEEIEAQEWKPDTWPITGPMLTSALRRQKTQEVT